MALGNANIRDTLLSARTQSPQQSRYNLYLVGHPRSKMVYRMSRGDKAMKTLLIVLFVPMLVVPAGAQPEPEASVPHGSLLEDAEGDIEIDGGESLPTGSAAHSGIDLVSMSIDEFEEYFLFRLRVADLQDGGLESMTPALFRAHFQYGEASYRIVITRGSDYDAGLEQAHDDDTWQHVARVGVRSDPDDEALLVYVSRDDIANEVGMRPGPGRPLTGFFVTSESTDAPRLVLAGNDIGLEEADDALANYIDRMPDQGVGDQDLEPRLGLVQTGHGRLASALTIRDSNGEASTFVFNVEAHNGGENRDMFTLRTSDIPDGWTVRLPTTTIAIEAGENVELPVVLYTPSRHIHGELSTFILEMASHNDPSAVGRIELGLNFVETPQPAGHHNTLHLHPDKYLNRMYMNTMQEDVDRSDPDRTVSHRKCSSIGYEGDIGILQHEYCWAIPLHPWLTMGLDFDLDATGELVTSIRSSIPLENAVLSGRLWWSGAFGPGWSHVDPILLAELTATTPIHVASETDTPFETTVVPTPEADYIPFSQPVAGLTLQIKMQVDLPNQDHASTLRPTNLIGPQMQGGGHLRLPLLDYYDPVDEIFSGRALLVAAVQERMVNPGETIVFDTTLQNQGGLEDAFLLDLAGKNAAWARLLHGRTVPLAGGASAPIAVAVTVPADAGDGERADLILEAAGSADQEARALLRLVAVVDTDEDHPDESSTADSFSDERESPLPLAATVVAVALGVFLRRRR